MSRRVSAVREALLRRAPASVVRSGTAVVRAVIDIEPFDRGMTLGAQAFTSIFPLILTLAAVLPRSKPLADVIADGLGVPPATRQVLEEAMRTDTGARGVFGLAGVLVVLVSATSFARALARMYGRVWAVRPPGWHGAWRWIATLVGIILVAGTLRLLGNVSAAHTYGAAGQAFVTVVLNAAFWTWVPWLLLQRQVAWRALAPGGLLMGLCAMVISTIGAIYLRLALTSSAQLYGAFGVAFTYITWLFVLSFALIAATVIGATLTRQIPLLERWALRTADVREQEGRGHEPV